MAVPGVFRCCEGAFLNQGKNSAINHCICHLWTSKPVDVVELAGAFLLKMVAVPIQLIEYFY